MKKTILFGPDFSLLGSIKPEVGAIPKFLFCSSSYLDELSIAGECAAEYLALYQKLIKPAHWKVYLAARGVLPYIGNLITKVSSKTVDTIGLYSEDVSFPLT